MSKLVHYSKNVLFTLLTFTALIIIWALGCVALYFTTRHIGVWGGVVAACLLIGLLFFGVSNLLYKLSGKLPLLSHKVPMAIVAVAIFLAAAIAIFGVPIKTPEIETANVPHETLTLSKGEQIALYHFQPETKISEMPVLFVPGGPGGPVSPSAMEFLKQLAAQGFDVYTFDHYTSGNSSLNTFDPSLLTIDEDVRRVHEILEKIGKPQAYVIGHSYAGALLGRVDALYPEQIARLVLLDTSPLYDLGHGNLKSAATLDPKLGKLLNEEYADTGSETGGQPSPFIANLTLRENIRGILMMFLQGKDGMPLFGKPEEVDFYVEELADEAASQEALTADSPRKFTGLSHAAQAINKSIEQSPDYSDSLIKAETSPVLVVHPNAGVVPWPIHKDYENFFDSVVFFPLADAHHGVWVKPENATLLTNLIRDFLLDGADPALFYTGYADPFKK